MSLLLLRSVGASGIGNLGLNLGESFWSLPQYPGEQLSLASFDLGVIGGAGFKKSKTSALSGFGVLSSMSGPRQRSAAVQLGEGMAKGEGV